MNKRYAPSFLCLVAFLIAELLAPNGLVAQPSSSPREDFWITDGPVKAILVTNGIAYIGGTFGNVGPRRSFGAVLDCQTGEADLDFPKVLGIPGVAYPDTGVISAVAPDGNGGWFIGGTFTNLGGVQRNGLAHMLSDGTIDPAWNPAPEFIPDFTDNGPVLALLAWQNRVYVAGRFILIGGLPRNNLAALDAVDGEAVDWDPSPNSLVLAIAVGGDKLYVGGTFTSLASQNRNRIAAFDLQTGNLTSWNPSASSTVSAIAASGANVYVGGYFATIGGRSRPYLAALSVTTGVATGWNPAPAGPTTYVGAVDVLAVSAETVYAGGHFTNIGGMPRNFLAALDVNTGLATSWNPDIGTPACTGCQVIRTLQVSSNTVYVGGSFQSVSGTFRRNLAAVDASTGQVVPWNPNPIAGDTYPSNGDAYSLAIQGNKIFAGGNFLGMNAQKRSNLAALDANTGTLNSWNPSVAGSVNALAYAGQTLYLGGNFTNVGGRARSQVAAVDAATGTILPWAPQIQGTSPSVAALAISSNIVVIGGTFTNVGGFSRRNLAAVDAATGIPTPWDPDPDGQVSALVISSNFVYVGGSFTSIGGQTRLRGVAAAELSSGNVTSFNPDPTTTDRSATLAMVTKANLLFAGGYVSPLFLGPQPRLTAFDVRDSTTLWDQNPWTARPGRQINALADSVNLLYVGGRSIDGQGLKNLAALNPSSGQTSSWNPAVGEVLSLAVSDETVFAGGQYAGGLAVFSPPGFLRLTAQLAENGSFRLRVGAAANETYIIQCSSNLVQWLDLATNSGAGLFKDAAGTPWPRRFYRAVTSQ